MTSGAVEQGRSCLYGGGGAAAAEENADLFSHRDLQTGNFSPEPVIVTVRQKNRLFDQEDMLQWLYEGIRTAWCPRLESETGRLTNLASTLLVWSNCNSSRSRLDKSRNHHFAHLLTASKSEVENLQFNMLNQC